VRAFFLKIRDCINIESKKEWRLEHKIMLLSLGN
jgi:hypothetical protein